VLTCVRQIPAHEIALQNPASSRPQGTTRRCPPIGCAAGDELLKCPPTPDGFVVPVRDFDDHVMLVIEPP